MSNLTSKPHKKPQFLHLHPIQAAKAKRAWVNKTKLRSQWAKQKRKLPADSADQEMEVDSDANKNYGRQPEETGENAKVVEGPVVGPSRKRKHSSRSEEKASHRKPAARQPSAPVDEIERRKRVRYLSRQAHAPESLHTFKAGPLHRRTHGSTTSRGRAAGTGKPSQSSRAGGQPNMMLRMNALLEKIKMDVGVS